MTPLDLSDHSDLHSQQDEEEVERSLLLAQLVTSCSNLIIIFIYWSYLLYASFSQPLLSSSWPPVFPHILLLGATLGSASNLASVTLSSGCHSSSLLPISYSLVYSAMLVRLVVLHSLHRDMMYKLPTIYQALLLVFTALVQLCLSAQSVILSLASSDQVCPPTTSLTRDITHFSYSAFLLLFITCLSTILRRRKENRAEAAAIWYFSLLSLAVWLAWLAVSLVFGQFYTHVRGLGLEASVVVLFITFLLPKSRRLTLVGKIYEYRQTQHIPVFGFPRHNTFSTTPGSYLGFHRPTRVVPPSSSHSSSKSSSSSPYSGQQQQQYHRRYQPWFLQPQYRRFDKSGSNLLLSPASIYRNYNSGMLNRNLFSPQKRKNYYDDYVSFHDKYNFGL